MATGDEEENIAFLTSMMGDGDPEVARRVLRKHNGDMQKAASSILEGDTGETVPSGPEWTWGLMPQDQESTSAEPRTPPPSKPEQDLPVIDLTSEDGDKDLNAALAASLETAPPDLEPTFGPSNRAPDPSWAVVPSNVEQPSGLSSEDQSLSRAIQESLNSSYNDLAQETYEQIPLEDRIRKDGRPVALRPGPATGVYVALVLQALYFVPQVRASIAPWRPSHYREASALPTSGDEHVMWTILEMFAHMDLAVLTEMDIDAALRAFEVETNGHGYTGEGPGEVSYQLFLKLALVIETALHKDVACQSHSWPRLFHFRYGTADSEPNLSPFDRRIDTSVVKVDVHEDGADPADLVSSLSKQLIVAHQQVIFEPSDVVTFHLVRHNTMPSYSSGPPAVRQPFRYPKYIYLDQFMKENAELASTKRRQQRELSEEIQRLEVRQSALKKRNTADTLKDLLSSLHYFEKIANREEPARKQKVDLMAMKLRKTLTRIENELETIESEISKMKTQSTGVFDGPELQKHRYDLRVVLVHDGLFGRSHIYSYVKEGQTWWKTVDYAVTEVSEEVVLTDSTGLHLGAGPYLLIYSRAIADDEKQFESLPWPDRLKVSIRDNNRQLLSSLPPEVARQARYTSPDTSSSMSEWETPLSSVEPPSSPQGEPMDIGS